MLTRVVQEAKGHLVTIKAELDDAVQQSSMDALQQELHVVESLSSDINVAVRLDLSRLLSGVLIRNA